MSNEKSKFDELIVKLKGDGVAEFKNLTNQVFLVNNLYLLIIVQASGKMSIPWSSMLPVLTIVLVLINRILMVMTIRKATESLENNDIELTQSKIIDRWISNLNLLALILTLTSTFIIAFIIYNLIDNPVA